MVFFSLFVVRGFHFQAPFIDFSIFLFRFARGRIFSMVLAYFKKFLFSFFFQHLSVPCLMYNVTLFEIQINDPLPRKSFPTMSPLLPSSLFPLEPSNHSPALFSTNPKTIQPPYSSPRHLPSSLLTEKKTAASSLTHPESGFYPHQGGKSPTSPTIS